MPTNRKNKKQPPILNPELTATIESLLAEGFLHCGSVDKFFLVEEEAEKIGEWSIGEWFKPFGIEVWHDSVGLFFKEFEDLDTDIVEADNIPKTELLKVKQLLSSNC